MPGASSLGGTLKLKAAVVSVLCVLPSLIDASAATPSLRNLRSGRPGQTQGAESLGILAAATLKSLQLGDAQGVFEPATVSCSSKLQASTEALRVMTKRALDAEARLEAMKAGTGSKAGPPARMHKPDATTLWKGVHSLLARCAQDTGDEKVAPGATAWENVHSLLARCEINMDEARDEDTPSAPVPANEEGGEGGASCKGEEEAPEEGPAVADRWRRMWVSAARLLAAVGDASGAHSSGEDMLSSTEDAPSLASMGKEVELRRANTELSASRLWADFLADKLQEAESRLATPRRRIPAHGSTAPQEDTQQDTQKESSDAWDAREWRGTFVQNAATSIQMALKMRAIAPQPQGEAGALLCSGEVT